MSRCIGFGDKDGNCANEAGTPWGPLWCAECDEERLASITASMERISANFGLPTEETDE